MTIENLRVGPVSQTLRRMAIPAWSAQVALMLFVLVDTYFVGLLGSVALAAISYMVPIGLLVFTIAGGLGLGVTAMISHAWGAAMPERSRSHAVDGLLISASAIIALAVLGLFTIRPLFTLMGAHGAVLDAIEHYMIPWYVAVCILIVPMTANSILRGLGDMRAPLATTLLMAVINLSLDPVLIFGWGPFPRLGIAGAAWATAISALCGSLYSLWLLLGRDRLLSISDLRPTLMRLRTSSRELFAVAIPGSVITAIPPIGMAAVTAFLARHSDAAVTTFAVGGRIELLAQALPAAMATVMLSFAGQHWSAGAFSRLEQGWRLAARGVAVWGLVACLLLFVARDSVASLFSNDPLVLDGLTTYLGIVPFSFAGQGVAIVASAQLLAIGRSGAATVVALAQALILMLPAVALGLFLGGLTGCFAGVAIANIMAGVLAWFMTSSVLQRNSRPRHRTNPPA